MGETAITSDLPEGQVFGDPCPLHSVGDPEDLADRLHLKQLSEDCFEGATPSAASNRVFGGQLVAQALLAAYESVGDRFCHAVQCTFLLPGDPRSPLIFNVDNVREGRAFATRHVTVCQNDRPIFVVNASFHLPEVGIDHQRPMPLAAAWRAVVDDRDNEQFWPAGLRPDQAPAWHAPMDPIEIRTVRSAYSRSPDCSEAAAQFWMRARKPLGASVKMQQVGLAYASDLSMIFTAMRPHNVKWTDPGFQGATLNHTIWFHRLTDFNHWHLYDQHSPNAFGGRGLTHGSIYNEAGLLVASSAQETLIRGRTNGRST